MLEITKIEKVRITHDRSEFLIMLNNNEFIILKRFAQETIINICEEIKNLGEITIQALRTLQREGKL